MFTVQLGHGVRGPFSEGGESGGEAGSHVGDLRRDRCFVVEWQPVPRRPLRPRVWRPPLFDGDGLRPVIGGVGRGFRLRAEPCGRFRAELDDRLLIVARSLAIAALAASGYAVAASLVSATHAHARLPTVRMGIHTDSYESNRPFVRPCGQLWHSRPNGTRAQRAQP